jgi:hypothetical protein
LARHPLSGLANGQELEPWKSAPDARFCSSYCSENCPGSRLNFSGHRLNKREGSGKQVASYLGLAPLEESSGNRRRLGHIKQGSSMLRFLLVEAAQVTVRSLPEWRSKYLHLMMRRGRKTAKVAMARRLAVRLYWMMRQGWDYEQVKKFGSHAGQPGNRDGVQ